MGADNEHKAKKERTACQRCFWVGRLREQRLGDDQRMDCLALGLVHYWLTCPLVLCYFSKMGERG